MFNKILVFWWIALSAILIIENIVQPNPALIFISYSSAWMLSVVSIIIWMAMWYWVKLMFDDKWHDDDNYDF